MSVSSDPERKIGLDYWARSTEDCSNALHYEGGNTDIVRKRKSRFIIYIEI